MEPIQYFSLPQVYGAAQQIKSNELRNKILTDQVEREGAARNAFAGAYGGDPEAMKRLMAADPELGLKIGEARQSSETAQLTQQKTKLEIARAQAQEVARLAAGVLQVDPSMREGAYQHALARLQAQGLDTSSYPQQYDEQAVRQAVNAGRDLEAMLKRQDLPQGWIWDESTGKPTQVPGYYSAEAGLRAAGAPRMTVQNISEGAFAKTMGEGTAKDALDLTAAANKAVEQLATIDNLKTAVQAYEAAGGETGKLSDLKNQGAALAQSLGIDPASLGLPADAGPGQLINSLTNQLALGKVGSGGLPANNFSEADRNFLVQTVPNLSDTPAGLQAKMAVAERAAQRTVQAVQAWQQYPQSAEGWRKFQQDWTQHVSSTPLLSEEEKAQIRGLTAAPAPAMATPANDDPLGLFAQ